MNKIAPHFLILPLAFLFLDCAAQRNYELSKPELSLEETTLIIAFDIKNSFPSEKFLIQIEVADSNGNRILPKSIEGDVGENVVGGNDRLIKWDLEADRVSLDQELQVEVVGTLMIEEEIMAESKQITRIGAMARTALFPGWGLSIENPGKPHWIKGVAGYCSLSGALILNQSAHSNYQRYLDSNEETERNDYYNSSSRQEQISEVLAYSAVGIWAAELIWTLIGTKNSSKQYGSMQHKGVSLGTNFEVVGKTPLLELRYTF